MSRSPGRRSPYITASGRQALCEELDALWRRRAGVTQALAAAAAEGDRSENAEYIYRKQELRGLDRRIRYLQKRLPDLKVVDRVSDTSRVFFGAYVTLQKQPDGGTVEYRIVGADEIDPARGYISFDAPLARSLLKTTVDDEVELHLDERVDRYRVCAVRYD